MTIVLGLAGALAYGFADFLGGLASRRIRPILATAWMALVGLAPLAVGLLLVGGRFTPDAVWWGVVAGLSGSLGVLMLYTALAIGPMSVLSPATSVLAVLLPVGIGVVAAGVQLSGIEILAVAVAIIAVALVGAVKSPSGARVTGTGVIAAVLAGCGFGGLVLAYAGTSPEDGIAPLVVARVVQAVAMWIGVALTSRRVQREAGAGASGQRGPGPRLWVLLAVGGTLDAAANVFIQAALHSGDAATTLPVVSVLNALYPIGTVLLAAIVLKERLSVVQICGLALALTASAVLAAQ